MQKQLSDIKLHIHLNKQTNPKFKIGRQSILNFFILKNVFTHKVVQKVVKYLIANVY